MKNEIFEIERKFLVKSLPEEIKNCKKLHIKQAYISTNPTIRLRQQDDEYILTVKGFGTMKKVEYELPLTKEQFDNLWKKSEGNVIIKTRHKIPLDNNLIAELDIYEGNLDGFMNVEVEFSSTKEAILFNPPTWFGQEVTQNKEYSNASLSKFGIPKN
ncbi:MAG: CYTH domain-containing protein [Lachnospirales bacterium]